MIYDIIATGSTGNCVLINNRIAIDMGIPFKKIEPYLHQIQLVLLTHEHGDHFRASTVAEISRQRPSVRWGCCQWMVQKLLDVGVPSHQIDLYKPHKWSVYGDLKVMPEELHHNVPNCGYHIVYSGEKLFYATDTGDLEGIKAKDYDLYLIEANHTKLEITQKILEKLKSGEYAYEYKAAENHLSREQATDWLLENVGPDSEFQFLHQHKGGLDDGSNIQEDIPIVLD